MQAAIMADMRNRDIPAAAPQRAAIVSVGWR
jgi:hypothetical protein